MIIKKVEIIEEYFRLTTSIHSDNWCYYYTQYNQVLDMLLKNALRLKYDTNCQFMSFMFIFRHTVELMLKCNIDNKGQEVPRHHRISELSGLLSIPIDFVEKISPLNCSETGDCFRYLKDRDGNLALSNEPIKLLSAVYDFINYDISQLLKIKSSVRIDPQNKFLNHELTFYPSECRYLDVVRTHYDYTIATLMEYVNAGVLDINTIYLPLLFLIRHSTELALKCNLYKISDQLSERKRAMIIRGHSILSLHNLLNGIVEVAIEKIPLNNPLLEDAHQYNGRSRKLSDCIHNLDTRSLSFRFPDNLSLDANMIIDIYRLYIEVDAYLTFVVDVLFENGYLDINDEYVSDYFGCQE